MQIILIDRQHILPPVSYLNPVTINCDKAGDIYSAADIAGNGLRPETLILSIQLPNNKQATFTAERWTVLFVPEVKA